MAQYFENLVASCNVSGFARGMFTDHLSSIYTKTPSPERCCKFLQRSRRCSSVNAQMHRMHDAFGFVLGKAPSSLRAVQAMRGTYCSGEAENRGATWTGSQKLLFA